VFEHFGKGMDVVIRNVDFGTPFSRRTAGF
jgi:hypothetical protein